MKTGAENRKKTIVAGALGAVALCCFGYFLMTELGGGSSSPAPAPKPAAATEPSDAISQRAETIKSASSNAAPANAQGGLNGGLGPLAGVPAEKVAHTNASLDPTLDETAMLRTENLVYTGSGRNIFSLVYVPPAPEIPKVAPNPRPIQPGPIVPQGPPVPPPPPPIPLKFFGTVKGAAGPLRAFLLNDEDVYLASQGDIVAHKYKIHSISATNIQIEDLSNHNTQTLPLQAQ